MRETPARNKKFLIMAPLVVIMALLVVYFASWAVNAAGAGATRIDIRAVDADGPGFTLADNAITITRNGNYLITGTTNIRRVVVQSGLTDVNITLSDVDINLIDGVFNAFSVAAGAAVNLTLVESNTLRSYTAAGLFVGNGATLVITGTGSLAAAGGRGIVVFGGSGYIMNGTITATSIGAESNGAGIFVIDRDASVGNITIQGGTVTAHGSFGGPGIGGGGTITISGNADVTAYGGNSPYGGGAGIGGGAGSGSGNITITDAAAVTAWGGDGIYLNRRLTGGGAGVGSGGGFLTNYGGGTVRWSNAGALGTVIINNTGRREFTGGMGTHGWHNGANVGTGGDGRAPGVEMEIM